MTRRRSSIAIGIAVAFIASASIAILLWGFGAQEAPSRIFVHLARPYDDPLATNILEARRDSQDGELIDESAWRLTLAKLKNPHGEEELVLSLYPRSAAGSLNDWRVILGLRVATVPSVEVYRHGVVVRVESNGESAVVEFESQALGR